MTAAAGALLSGHDGVGNVVPFAAADVQVHPLTKRGRTIGMTFLAGDSHKYDLRWAKGYVPGQQNTRSFPVGTTPFFDRAWGGDVRKAQAPWTADTFYISTHGLEREFIVTLADGTQLGVSGETFAHVVAVAKPFQAAVRPDDRSSITLMVCRVGAEIEPGGAAYDFQRTLESRFGYRQPVAAATKNVVVGAPPERKRTKVPGWIRNLWSPQEKLPSLLAIRDGGHWRVFSSGSAGVLGADASGKARYFTADEVMSTPLTENGRTAGISFDDQATGQRPGYGTEVPWQHGSFLVDASSIGHKYRLLLSDGTRVRVDGDGLAQVVAQSAVFRTAVSDGQVPSVVLLARTSLASVLGSSAHGPEDFRAALLALSGLTGPVFAPVAGRPLPGAADNATGWREVGALPSPLGPDELGSVRSVRSTLDPVSVRGAGPSSSVVLETEAGWNRQPDVVDNVRLTGFGRKMDGFHTSDVRVRLLENDGRPLGISFSRGEELRFEVGLFADHAAPVTYIMPDTPDGSNPLLWAVQARHEGLATPVPVPWPRNSVFVSVHGKPGSFLLFRNDSPRISLDGTGFANLLHDLRGFRAVVERTNPGAVVLLTCKAGASSVRGGAAYDFQRALGALGYRQPVVAATDTVYLDGFDAGHWSTGIANRGTWKVFSSGTANLLGRDTLGNKVVAFSPGDVEATPLLRGDRVVGVSFRADADATRTGPDRRDRGGSPSSSRPTSHRAAGSG